MNTYLTLFAIALSSSLFLTPVLRRAAQRLGWVDTPSDGRRLHTLPVPRVGGAAIYCSVGLSLPALPLVDNRVTEVLGQSRREVVAVLLSSTFVFAYGLFDDLVGAKAKWKFIAQGAAALLLFALGVRIHAVTVPLVGSFEIPTILSLIFTLVWVIGISNAFNLIDGLDGLATGAALFASLVMAAASLVNGRPLVTVISLALCGALAGFLRYNFNPASIFLGDSGSLFTGFLLAALSVLGTQKATTAVAIVVPILAFGFPMVDTAMTMARRLVSRNPVFEGDSEHIHHMLLARGWSQRRAALVLYGACALFGLVALIFPVTGSKLTGFMLFVISVAVIIAVGHLRYHEVDELRAGVKRTVGDRRLRVANNIRVRRAAVAVSKASDLGEMFEAVRHLLEFGEFSFASAELGPPGRRCVCWSWPDEVEASAGDWSIRLPLVKDGVE